MTGNASTFQHFAEKMAINAGAIIGEYKNKYKVKKYKDKIIDIATDADYASEKYIVDTIRKNYPSHSILSEEALTRNRKSSEYEWIIDPLDGSKEFIRNIPLYCVNISLERKHELIVGVVYQPEQKRLYSVSSERKPTLNGEPLHVSIQKDIHKSLVQLRLPDYRMSQKYLKRYMRLFSDLVSGSYRLRGNIWDVETLCYVASGALEAYIFTGTKDWSPPQWWDLSAGILMVQQAGGMVTDFLGKPIENRDLTRGLIASNGAIHQNLLQLTKDFHS